MDYRQFVKVLALFWEESGQVFGTTSRRKLAVLESHLSGVTRGAQNEIFI